MKEKISFWIISYIILVIFSVPSFATYSSELETLKDSYLPGETVEAVFMISNDDYSGLETNIVITYVIENNDKTKVISEKTATLSLRESRTKVLLMELPETSLPGKYYFAVSFEIYGEIQSTEDYFYIEGNTSYMPGIVILLLVGVTIAAFFLKFKR